MSRLGKLLDLDPVRSDERRRRWPYLFEVADWFHAHILPLPSDDLVMEGYDAAESHTSEWWSEWTNRTKGAYPLRYWLHHTASGAISNWVRRYGHNPYWWLRHRLDPRHRYHIIRTGLKAGYWDPDSRILYGVMNIVEEFVEDTSKTVNWESDPGHQQAWEVLQAAVIFWGEYKAFWKDAADAARWAGDDRETHRQAMAIEDRMEREANRHLAKVMRIRRYLWYPLIFLVLSSALQP